jgi:hypothetical protein
MDKLCHDDLIRIGAHWLMGTMRCGAVVSELISENGESPDIIGWRNSVSMVVECKVSRGDFLADKKKPFRSDPCKGMGKLRYYLTPKGLLVPDDLKDSTWGLLETSGKQVRIILPSHQFLQRDMRAELRLMYTCLQRIQLRIAQPLSEVVRWSHNFQAPILIMEELQEQTDYL